jgi:hypothetical protein
MSSAVSMRLSGGVDAIWRMRRMAQSSARESLALVRYGPSKIGGSLKWAERSAMRPRERGWLFAISIDAMSPYYERHTRPNAAVEAEGWCGEG